MKVDHAVSAYVTYKQSLGMRFATEARTLKSFSKYVGDIDLDQVGPVLVRRFLDGNGPLTRFWHRKFSVLTGLYRFCLTAQAIGADVPFVLQDYPLTFTVQMSPGVIRRIVTENPSCVMLKHEDWPGLEKSTALRAWERAGEMRHTAILVGNNGLFLDYEMERGADGANTGYAFPDMLCDVVRLSHAGEREQAHDLFDAHLPLLRYEQQPGIGLTVRKYLLYRRGLLGSPALRQPAAALGKVAQAEVEHLLQRLALHDPRARLGSV